MLAWGIIQIGPADAEYAIRLIAYTLMAIAYALMILYYAYKGRRHDR